MQSEKVTAAQQKSIHRLEFEHDPGVPFSALKVYVTAGDELKLYQGRLRVSINKNLILAKLLTGCLEDKPTLEHPEPLRLLWTAIAGDKICVVSSMAGMRFLVTKVGNNWSGHKDAHSATDSFSFGQSLKVSSITLSGHFITVQPVPKCQVC